MIKNDHRQATTNLYHGHPLHTRTVGHGSDPAADIDRTILPARATNSAALCTTAAGHPVLVDRAVSRRHHVYLVAILPDFPRSFE